MTEQTCSRNDEMERPIDAWIEASLPAVRRWAHGRLPRSARGQYDTTDLVQEAALRVLQRRGQFFPRHAGAVQRYIRLTFLNLVRDHARLVARRPGTVEMETEPP